MRRLSLLLLAAAVMLLPGCRRTHDHRRLVAIIVPSEDNPFFKAEADAAAAEAQRLGYRTRIDTHGDDAYEQDNLVDVAIASNAAVLILDNAGTDASISAVRRAARAGIACFLIDRDIGASGLAKAQIIADNAGGARLLATHFATMLGGKGNYLELTGRESDTNAQVRSGGFHAVLRNYPQLHRLAAQSANWSQSEAFEKTETMLQAHNDVQGILAANDTMALGAVAALRGLGDRNVTVVGFDGSPDALEAIRDGSLNATILQPAVKIARLAVDEADQYLHTGSTGKPERQVIACDLVTHRNVQDFRAFQRIHSEPTEGK